MPMPIHGLNNHTICPTSRPLHEASEMDDVGRGGAMQDPARSAEASKTSRSGPRPMHRCDVHRQAPVIVADRMDSKTLALLVVFFPPSSFPFAFSRGPPTQPRQSPALICSAPPGPVRLGGRIAVHTAAVVDAVPGTVMRVVVGVVRGRGRALILIRADSGGDGMPAYGPGANQGPDDDGRRRLGGVAHRAECRAVGGDQQTIHPKRR
ncbi:hypothetical protein B0H13DRAFT_2278790 [Mycena leptocephala]|nr:hypothetical protein B0H13DRAFT_2278790 [Mycena leptocephala]